MAAWGTGPFASDHALDRLRKIVESDDGFDEASSALQAAADAPQDKLLGMEPSVLVFIAAELVAARQGSPSSRLPARAAGWVERTPGLEDPRLREVAARAVRNLRRGSELRNGWEALGRLEAWLSDVDDLARRLR